ncbi:transposase [Litorivivens sp.]|uniref:transposase n=1 Tax=Litorivivens sp. TaxID=2020868 RepID=UPI003562CC8F
MPYHVVQRGNNREPCFVEPENFQFYLQLWEEVSKRYGVDVHAFCLMTNHIHFLVTPHEQDALSNTMKVVGSRYAQHFNSQYRRTGTLWEGRHRSSLVQSESYTLLCYRYIELNPVRASMVAHPGEYQWSSYQANAWGESHWLKPHEEYRKLGPHAAERQHAYRELFRNSLDSDDIHKIQQGTQYNHPVADDRFCRMIEEKYGIKVGKIRRGRPPKRRI